MIPEIPQSPKSPVAGNLEQLREIAHSFEGIFFQMLQKSMRATIKPSGLMGGGQAEEIFTQLFDAEVAERGSGRSGGTGLGIAESIIRMYGKRFQAEAAPVEPTRDWKA